MKKMIVLALATVIMFALSACAGGGSSQSAGNGNAAKPSGNASAMPDPADAPSPDAGTSAASTSADNSGTKVLVAYFSLPETSNAGNMTVEEDNSVVVINGEVLGNTQYVAYLIQENTGGDIFRIETKTPYPTEHDVLVDLADREKAKKARPELLSNVENIEQYDVIFLGYPNWWGDMPMVLYTFLEANDLSGKTIIPFNTHGGSGFSNTVSTITQLQPNATVVKKGFTVSRNTVAECEDDLMAWLKTMSLAN